jgi:hypothetical protein
LIQFVASLGAPGEQVPIERVKKRQQPLGGGQGMPTAQTGNSFPAIPVLVIAKSSPIVTVAKDLT